ncbi:SagB family peptide dehydrogenase [Solirubrobacter soli]|uniref:SagB family peptide dehydrogenase n=1 Tax=Solirubrobacter soli TaxID=363832 RepID=UPI00041853C7|nr:SagB family peptide dehydrogenase [Solirubrobacter soli]
MNVRVAASGSLAFREGAAVWDNHLDHRQHALTELSLDVLRHFSDWRELASAAELGPRHEAVARRLLEAGVLVAEDSLAHARELHVTGSWGRWGGAAERFHFASRTTSSTTFATPASSFATMRHQGVEETPPAIAARRHGEPIALPGTRIGDWQRPDVVSALLDRRSARSFTDAPVALDDLAAILHVAGGFLGVFDELGTGPEAYKTSPSAGALHPNELYVRARRVSGLQPGTYHYDAAGGHLVRVGAEAVDIDDPRAYGDQEWPALSPVTLLHTAVVARNQWRYRTPRGYRDVLLGLGHVSQTILLAAGARGLGGTFATAIRDEVLERHLGCDGVDEIVLGVTALGCAGIQLTPDAVSPTWLR